MRTPVFPITCLSLWRVLTLGAVWLYLSRPLTIEEIKQSTLPLLVCGTSTFYISAGWFGVQECNIQAVGPLCPVCSAPKTPISQLTKCPWGLLSTRLLLMEGVKIGQDFLQPETVRFVLSVQVKFPLTRVTKPQSSWKWRFSGPTFGSRAAVQRENQDSERSAKKSLAL